MVKFRELKKYKEKFWKYRIKIFNSKDKLFALNSKLQLLLLKLQNKHSKKCCTCSSVPSSETHFQWLLVQEMLVFSNCFLTYMHHLDFPSSFPYSPKLSLIWSHCCLTWKMDSSTTNSIKWGKNLNLNYEAINYKIIR